MRRAGTLAAIIVGVTLPAAAQDRDWGGRQGIPPGHLPPPGQCRVWYDDRSPGQQPPPTSCREAARVAAGDRSARVLYGGDGQIGRERDGRGNRDRDRDRPRAVPRRAPWPDQYPERAPYPGGSRRYPDRGVSGRDTVAFDNGYRDGVEKGREDAGDRDDYDPVRHGRYRDADRGYDKRYGSKSDYKLAYRDGFEAGYEDGYRGRDRGDRSGRRGPVWPF